MVAWPLTADASHGGDRFGPGRRHRADAGTDWGER
jgi:hypothetical protein